MDFRLQIVTQSLDYQVNDLELLVRGHLETIEIQSLNCQDSQTFGAFEFVAFSNERWSGRRFEIHAR